MANSMASAVGAKAITIRQAVMIAAVLNLVGATFIGSHVTNTIRKGIISAEVMADPQVALIGAFSALIAAALWLTFATWKSLPVSTTHSIVGAMIGFGVIAGGLSVIQWGKVGAVVASWIISPVFSLVIGFAIYKIITRFILNRKNSFVQALKLSPYFIGAAVFIIVLSFLFKTPLGTSLSVETPMAVVIAVIIAVVGWDGWVKIITQVHHRRRRKWNRGDLQAYSDRYILLCGPGPRRKRCSQCHWTTGSHLLYRYGREYWEQLSLFPPSSYFLVG